MRVHSIVENSRVNGPGNRAVVWLQGCAMQPKCPGCQNPDTHSFGCGEAISPIALAEKVLAIPDITGVTFSGGEPLNQLDDGLDITIGTIRNQRPDFSIGLFTGYTQGELEAGNFQADGNPKVRTAKKLKADAWHYLQSKLDFAVMGRYNRALPSTRPMCSSDNQALVLFSSRHSAADFPPQQVEILIQEDGGRYQTTGFPEERLNA